MQFLPRHSKGFDRMAFRTPQLLTHRDNGYVSKQIDGQRWRLKMGPTGPAADAAYKRFCADYKANRVDWTSPDFYVSDDAPRRPVTPAVTVDVVPQPSPGATIYTVAECLRSWLSERMLKDLCQSERGRTRTIAREIDKLFGDQPVDTFGTRNVKEFRMHLRTSREWGFKSITLAEQQLRAMLRHAVEMEMCSGQTAYAVDQMKRLQEDEYGFPPVVRKRPVEFDQMEKSLPFMAPSIADFVQVQFLCGMRPGEVCRLRGRNAVGDQTVEGGDRPVWEYSRADKVWLYRFDRHKVRKVTKQPLFKAVPKSAMRILERHIDRENNTTDGTGWLLRPSVAKAERDAARPARTTPLSWKERMRQDAKVQAAATYDPEADRYGFDNVHPSAGYSQAVRLAVKRAVAAGAIDTRWTANQLRHGVGTFITKQMNIDAAAMYLGHADSKVTRQHYAQLVDTVSAELGKIASVIDEEWPVA